MERGASITSLGSTSPKPNPKRLSASLDDLHIMSVCPSLFLCLFVLCICVCLRDLILLHLDPRRTSLLSDILLIEVIPMDNPVSLPHHKERVLPTVAFVFLALTPLSPLFISRFCISFFWTLSLD
jgi:hypothetical protein